jgi:hypothetical protein
MSHPPSIDSLVDTNFLMRDDDLQREIHSEKSGTKVLREFGIRIHTDALSVRATRIALTQSR